MNMHDLRMGFLARAFLAPKFQLEYALRFVQYVLYLINSWAMFFRIDLYYLFTLLLPLIFFLRNSWYRRFLARGTAIAPRDDQRGTDSCSLH